MNDPRPPRRSRSIREIAATVKVSVGVVHMTLDPTAAKTTDS
ncbi:hypothetical protein [Streptomyces virginiae]